jgi:hypothetical protein
MHVCVCVCVCKNTFTYQRSTSRLPTVPPPPYLPSNHRRTIIHPPHTYTNTPQPAKAVSAAVELNRYKYFRIDNFDHTHDIIIHLNTSSSSPKNIDMSDSILATHAAANANPSAGARADAARAWLPHYVFPIAAPPTAASGRIVRISDTAPQDARTLRAILRMLNDGLAPLEECHNGGTISQTSVYSDSLEEVKCTWALTSENFCPQDATGPVTIRR